MLMENFNNEKYSGEGLFINPLRAERAEGIYYGRTNGRSRYAINASAG